MNHFGDDSLEGDANSPFGAAPEDLPHFPTETEIYILPSGEVVVADLPAELSALVEAIGEWTDGDERREREP